MLVFCFGPPSYSVGQLETGVLTISSGPSDMLGLGLGKLVELGLTLILEIPETNYAPIEL